MQVEGRAHTEWTESHTRSVSNGRGGTSSQTYHETYSATEVYVDLRIHLWPNAPAPDEMMPAGQFVFPFAFQIPENAPSSFSGSHGSILYVCKAVIDRPWRFDSKCKVPFTVVGLVDLNLQQNALTPIRDSKSKEMGCCCCVSGHLQCDVDIPRGGFVPGESIPLTFSISNSSRSAVTETKVKLVENVVFRAKHGWSEHTKQSSRTVVELGGNGIESGDSQEWFGKFLSIPPVCPTLINCSIISLSYELEIKAYNDACCTAALKVFLPILIGNVPLRVVYQSAVPSAPAMDQVGPSAPPLPAYPDLPPPSYEEAIFGGGDIRDANDDENTTGPTKYAPRYPFYRWLSKPDAPT